jgi:hypothetical protein
MEEVTVAIGGYDRAGLVGREVQIPSWLSLESSKFWALAGWEESCITMFVNLLYFSKTQVPRWCYVTTPGRLGYAVSLRVKYLSNQISEALVCLWWYCLRAPDRFVHSATESDQIRSLIFLYNNRGSRYYLITSSHFEQHHLPMKMFIPARS